MLQKYQTIDVFLNSSCWISLFAFILAFMICFWQRTIKIQSLNSSCKWASNCLFMDSIELSLILDCFGDQITIKSTKTYTIWLETIAKVLNMLIGLKGNNYYSKVFKRVNYKLSNSTFWVVINICWYSMIIRGHLGFERLIFALIVGWEHCMIFLHGFG